MALLSSNITRTLPVISLMLTSLVSCRSKPQEPEANEDTQEAGAASAQVLAATKPPAAPTTKTGPRRVRPDDPLKGKFSMEDATKDLEGTGKLVATIDTSLGAVSCELYDEKAPITVANFVGLARGIRPFKKDGAWVKEPGYDGTTFHRIIKGFMIQGGDPAGTGAGEPGYVIPDEMWPGAKHDQRGLLCMANRGPHTNGMQFFITDASAPHLDRSYTIFGKCGPDETIEKIASVETPRSTGRPGGRGDQPFEAPKINSVKISRK